MGYEEKRDLSNNQINRSFDAPQSSIQESQTWVGHKSPIKSIASMDMNVIPREEALMETSKNGAGIVRGVRKSSSSRRESRGSRERSRKQTQKLLDRLNCTLGQSESNEGTDEYIEQPNNTNSMSCTEQSLKKQTRVMAQNQSCMPVLVEGGEKRISVRQLRLRKRAAVTIQKIARMFLAHKKYQHRLIQTEYLEYIKLQKEAEKWIEDQKYLLLTRLFTIHQQTKKDIQFLRHSTEIQKDRIAVEVREEFASQVQRNEEEMAAKLDEFQNEVEQLKREQEQVVSEIMLWRDLIDGLKDESEKLHAQNQQVMSMFTALNEFAKASMQDKAFLEKEANTYNKVQVNKINEIVQACTTYAMAETSLKDMYRGNLYRYANKIEDADIRESVFISIKECEDKLGKTLLKESEAAQLLNMEGCHALDAELESDEEESNST